VFVGYKIAGKRGVVMSVLGATLPSFLIILAIAMCFKHFRSNPHVEAVFKGIRPAVVALIAAPLYKMAKAAKVTWKNLWIPVAAALLIWLAGVNPVVIIIVAIAGGLFWTYWANRTNKPNKEKGGDA
jgi:chromate transporter